MLCVDNWDLDWLHVLLLMIHLGTEQVGCQIHTQLDQAVFIGLQIPRTLRGLELGVGVCVVV